MDVAQYEDFLSFLRSTSLPEAEWAYPPFVKSFEDRKVYRARSEHLRLRTKNVGTSELTVNREVLMYRVEVKVDGVMQVQEKENPTQQIVTQELAPLHVGFSASTEHTTPVRTQVESCWVLLSVFTGWSAGRCIIILCLYVFFWSFCIFY